MRYTAKDEDRVTKIKTDPGFSPEEYRTPWRRDYARLLHSPSFRRLQGKTQLFPGEEADFFRNRLTHSLEVAQIAKSITAKLNHDLKSAGEDYSIEPDIVEFAGLAHDLGHPPFGHFGEAVLDELMIDFGGFEGNAQTLRQISKIEKGHWAKNAISPEDDRRVGLNLTYRSMASILKYDNEIPFKGSEGSGRDEPIKGYYRAERELVASIKHAICNGKEHTGSFKTVECQIMDIADDIAYSTYDLEDSFKAGFIEPIDVLCASERVLEQVAQIVTRKTGEKIDEKGVTKRIGEIFFDVFDLPDGIEDFFKRPSRKDLMDLHLYSVKYAKSISDQIAKDGYQRRNLTSKWVGRAIRMVDITSIDREIPALSEIKLQKNKEIDVEILKNFVYQSQILSPRIQIVSHRSREIVETIFSTLSQNGGFALLPSDFRRIFEVLGEAGDKKRVVCDFVAGMTDRYALEFYGRLKSENPQTIFKPFW